MARTDAQQMIHHFESLLPLWVIDTTDVYDALKLALRVVSEESQDGYDARWRDVKG